MRNALVKTDVMEAFDTELLDKSSTDLMRLGAGAVGRWHAMVEHHHDAIRALYPLHVAPVGREEITVVEHDGVDIDDDHVSWLHMRGAAGTRENFFDDGHGHWRSTESRSGC